MTKTKTATKSIRAEGYGQNVDYTEHVILTAGSGAHTLRVIIHSDSYTDQAYGRIERFDGARWNEVAQMKGVSLKVDRHIGYKSDVTEAVKIAAFQADRNALLALAAEVL